MACNPSRFALPENKAHIKLTRKSDLSFLTSWRFGLCRLHWLTDEFAKTHFRVNFADDGAQRRGSPQQIVGFPNLARLSGEV